MPFARNRDHENDPNNLHCTSRRTLVYGIPGFSGWECFLSFAGDFVKLGAVDWLEMSHEVAHTQYCSWYDVWLESTNPVHPQSFKVESSAR